MDINQVYDRDERLEQALSAVEQMEPDFEKVLIDSAEADANAEIEYAKAFLAAEGTEKKREAEAKVNIERFIRERNRAKAVKEFTREKLKDRQAAVSARQTLLNSDLKTNRAFTG